MKKPLAVGAASAALLLALTACGSGNVQTAESTSANVAATASATAPAEAGEHNQADVTFAEAMIPHHSQAIEMSTVLLAKEGIDPRVRDLAGQIKAAQTPEIEQLSAWLGNWDQPMPSGAMPMSTPGMGVPHTSMPMGTPGMGVPGGSVPMGTAQMMPGISGMMSPHDMQTLQDAQGTEAARLFLTQMIEHHRGAIAMARTEVDTGQYPPAVTLAQNIIDTQQREITTMEQLLSSL